MSKELQEMGEKFYQYTAIDEYSRLRYTWFTNRLSWQAFLKEKKTRNRMEKRI